MYEPSLQPSYAVHEQRRRPVSWYTHSSSPPPPQTADSEATDTGTVVHNPPHANNRNVADRRTSHQSERVQTRQAKVTQTPYPIETDVTEAAQDAAAIERRPSHHSERIKTRQAKVTQTPYPADTPATANSGTSSKVGLKYGDESSEDEDMDQHADLEVRKAGPDVPIIAVPRKSSKRASRALLDASSSNASSTASSARNSYNALANGMDPDTNAHSGSNASSHPEATNILPTSPTNSSRGSIIFRTTTAQDNDRTPTNARQTGQAHESICSAPAFTRSASGVFHDASENLPTDEEHDKVIREAEVQRQPVWI
ncbi:uncharacterized protein AB675_1901 [Cyphellophora attinorum]|uniref:Uncharacterized protein n=1 Tax=Cyphellophora attinorum TaxID=1664694 RepID=A0A0N0NPW7_9EURO|nr:uncharacterized protein AB675_1901 [Phialophora attinorum]KPI43009.1 hypothetical protein AB675_1901 [Phialophora attinorum]